MFSLSFSWICNLVWYNLIWYAKWGLLIFCKISNITNINWQSIYQLNGSKLICLKWYSFFLVQMSSREINILVIYHNKNLLLIKGAGCKIRATIFRWSYRSFYLSISNVITCSSLHCLILLILVLFKRRDNYVHTSHYHALLWNLF